MPLMQTQKFPANYKNLPVIHMHGATRFQKPEGVAVLFGLVVFLYSTHILNGSFESGPTKYVTLDTFAEVFGNWQNITVAFFVLAILPCISAWIGFVSYLFSPTVTYKTGLLWSSLSLACLFFINMAETAGRGLSAVLFGIAWEYRVLQLLYLAILLLCMYKRMQLKKQSPDENQ